MDTDVPELASASADSSQCANSVTENSAPQSDNTETKSYPSFLWTAEKTSEESGKRKDPIKRRDEVLETVQRLIEMAVKDGHKKIDHDITLLTDREMILVLKALTNAGYDAVAHRYDSGAGREGTRLLVTWP
jgi:hypothetical protein